VRDSGRLMATQLSPPRLKAVALSLFLL
jgi:hypothetical protein